MQQVNKLSLTKYINFVFSNQEPIIENLFFTSMKYSTVLHIRDNDDEQLILDDELKILLTRQRTVFGLDSSSFKLYFVINLFMYKYIACLCSPC